MNPAGLDQLLLAAAKGLTRYAERAAAQKLGTSVNIWDGDNGLGAVMAEHLQAAGVPNLTLPQIVTPRAVVTAFKRPRRKKRVA